jgi:hypothetical protein
MWNISTIQVARYQIMQDVHVKVNQDCHGKRSIQQEEDSLYQQIGLTFKDVTSKMLHLEYSFVWC